MELWLCTRRVKFPCVWHGAGTPETDPMGYVCSLLRSTWGMKGRVPEGNLRGKAHSSRRHSSCLFPCSEAASRQRSRNALEIISQKLKLTREIG